MSFHSINNVMNSPSFELECCVHFRQCWFHFQRSRPLDGLCGFFTLFQRCFLLCACVCFRFYFHVLGLGTAFTVTDAEVLFLSLTFLVEISGFSLSFLVHSIPNVFPASFFIHVFLKLFWASIFFSVRSERFRFSFSYLFFFLVQSFICVRVFLSEGRFLIGTLVRSFFFVVIHFFYRFLWCSPSSTEKCPKLSILWFFFLCNVCGYFRRLSDDRFSNGKWSRFPIEGKHSAETFQLFIRFSSSFPVVGCTQFKVPVSIIYVGTTTRSFF